MSLKYEPSSELLHISDVRTTVRWMFRLRFRKAHDAYTAEELGATQRRRSRVMVCPGPCSSASLSLSILELSDTKVYES